MKKRLLTTAFSAALLSSFGAGLDQGAQSHQERLTQEKDVISFAHQESDGCVLIDKKNKSIDTVSSDWNKCLEFASKAEADNPTTFMSVGKGCAVEYVAPAILKKPKHSSLSEGQSVGNRFTGIHCS